MVGPKMRFMKVHVPYAAYLRNLDERKAVCPVSPFSAQLRAYLDDGFQQSDIASVGLRQFGWDCRDFVATHLGMSRAWLKEQGHRLGLRDIAREATFSAIRDFHPEVLLIYHHSFFGSEWVQRVRELVPGIKLVAWCGVSVEHRDELSAFDSVLTCNAELVKNFRLLGVNAHHVPFAFDPAIRERVLRYPSDGPYGVTFLGQVITQAGFHAGRASWLEQIADRHPVDIFTSWHGHTPIAFHEKIALRGQRELANFFPFLRGYSGQPRSYGVRRQSVTPHPYGRRSAIHPPRYGIQYLRTMYDSVVTLNHQPECAGSSASNMRLVEAAGMGACLLTDHKDNLEEILKPNSEVLVYGSVEECLERIDFVLKHPEFANDVRCRAAARVNRDNSPGVLGKRLHALFRTVL